MNTPVRSFFMEANLSEAVLEETEFNASTIWPGGFDPISRGAIRV